MKEFAINNQPQILENPEKTSSFNDEFVDMDNLDIQQEIEEILDHESGHKFAGMLPGKEQIWQNLLTESLKDDVSREQLVINLNKVRQAIQEIKSKERFFDENFSQKDIEIAKNYIKNIIEKIKNGEMNEIGKGNSAVVFTHPDFSDFCFKIIKGNLINDPSINNVEKEAEYLDRFSKVQVGNSRTPKPYYLLMDNEQGLHYLVMETMKAFSLDQFKEKGMKLPDNFDLDKAISDFKIYIENLNKDYYVDHNDIRDPNVMIDLENNAFILIDFGRSSGRKDEHFQNNESSDIKNLNIVMDKFLSYLKN